MSEIPKSSETPTSPEAPELPAPAAGEKAGDEATAASASSFTANLKKLPGISHLAVIDLFDAEGNAVARVENKPGSQGALAIYNHLAQTYGAITPEAARKGLDLFAEHAADARARPGKHPNIDRLLALIKDKKTLRIKHVFAF